MFLYIPHHYLSIYTATHYQVGVGWVEPASTWYIHTHGDLDKTHDSCTNTIPNAKRDFHLSVST